MILTRVHRAGCMIVYRRSRKYQTWVPLYVVGHTDGRMLEEFRRRRDAIRWADRNGAG